MEVSEQANHLHTEHLPWGDDIPKVQVCLVTVMPVRSWSKLLMGGGRRVVDCRILTLKNVSKSSLLSLFILVEENRT